MKMRQIGGVLAIAMAVGVFAADIPQLASLNATYERQLTELDRVYEAAVSNAPGQYVQNLTALEQKHVGGGNLDGVIAVRNERLRFEVDKALTEKDLVANPPDLAAAQTWLLDAPKRADMERMRGIDTLSRQYVDALERLKVQLTKTGRIQHALDVKAEIDRIGPLAAAAISEPRPAVVIQPPRAKQTTTDDPSIPKPKDRGLSLSTTWHINLATGNLKLTDTYDVIGRHGKAAVDLSFKAIKLVDQMEYLMPFGDAVRRLDKSVPTKKSIECPGFPSDCLRAYKFDGRFADGCNKMLLVTDIADKVVGVQYVDESPKETRLSGHTTKYHLFNFIETRAKASTSWEIRHVAERRGAVLVVRSEVVDTSVKPREYIELYLAMPVVDIISLSSNPDAMRQYRESQRTTLPTAVAAGTAKQPAVVKAEPSMEDITHTLRGGTKGPEGIVLKEKGLVSEDSYSPPVEIEYVCKTDSTNIRLTYAGRIIFNWEVDRSDLRYADGPVGRQPRPGAGEVPVNKFITIRKVITYDIMSVFVDGKYRASWTGDFRKVNAPVGIHSALGSTVTVKSIRVRKLPGDPPRK